MTSRPPCQVASDPLPGCTERAVTVVGSREAVTQCVYHICCVMLESPAKGSTVQYQVLIIATVCPGL